MINFTQWLLCIHRNWLKLIHLWLPGFLSQKFRLLDIYFDLFFYSSCRLLRFQDSRNCSRDVFVLEWRAFQRKLFPKSKHLSSRAAILLDLLLFVPLTLDIVLTIGVLVRGHLIGKMAKMVYLLYIYTIYTLVRGI